MALRAELLASKKTPEQRRAELAARARALAERREAERRQLAATLYEKAFIQSCDVLRGENSKRLLYRTVEERNAQVGKGARCYWCKGREVSVPAEGRHRTARGHRGPDVGHMYAYDVASYCCMDALCCLLDTLGLKQGLSEAEALRVAPRRKGQGHLLPRVASTHTLSGQRLPCPLISQIEQRMAARILEEEEKRMWHEMSEVERQKMEQRWVASGRGPLRGQLGTGWTSCILGLSRGASRTNTEAAYARLHSALRRYSS